MTPKQKADKVFSEYIRRRDCPNGKGRCISCGAPITPTTCDAGHYIPRTHLATRFDERNVNAQCRVCNQMEYGNETAYAIGLVRKYGFDTPQKLWKQSRQIVKMSRSDFQAIISKYKVL